MFGSWFTFRQGRRENNRRCVCSRRSEASRYGESSRPSVLAHDNRPRLPFAFVGALKHPANIAGAVDELAERNAATPLHRLGLQCNNTMRCLFELEEGGNYLPKAHAPARSWPRRCKRRRPAKANASGSASRSAKVRADTDRHGFSIAM